MQTRLLSYRLSNMDIYNQNYNITLYTLKIRKTRAIILHIIKFVQLLELETYVAITNFFLFLFLIGSPFIYINTV